MLPQFKQANFPGWIDQARSLAVRLAERSYVPYSGGQKVALAILSDGSWIPGVRVENASFSLVIPAVTNAVSSAVAFGRCDVAAIVTSGPGDKGTDAHYLENCAVGEFEVKAPEFYVGRGLDLPDELAKDEFSDFTPASLNDHQQIELARNLSARAYVHTSNFPVGCFAHSDDKLIPGVNVEHDDWTRTICAERNAIGTCVSYALTPPTRMVLSCPEGSICTPCGACRQVMSELAADAVVISLSANCDIKHTSVRSLLPQSFAGKKLRRY